MDTPLHRIWYVQIHAQICTIFVYLAIYGRGVSLKTSTKMQLRHVDLKLNRTSLGVNECFCKITFLGKSG